MYRIYDKEETYTVKAQKAGYPARSIYKLKEINEKLKIIKPGDRVLDLGSAPGSWLLYISQVVKNDGRVVGVDKSKITIKLPQNIVFLQKDIMDLKPEDLKTKKYDAVVSDMAPATSGVKLVDIGRSLDLSYKALEVALKFLSPRGNFVCKIFEGDGVPDFLKEVKKHFVYAKAFRPMAVIKGSKEIYMVAKGFKGIAS